MKAAWACLILAGGSLIGGCSPDGDSDAGRPSAQVVLRVGKQDITLGQLNMFFASSIGEFADTPDLDKVKSELLEDFIDELLLDQEALKAGVRVGEDEIRLFLREFKGDIPGDGEESELLRSELVRQCRVQHFVQGLAKGFTPDEKQIRTYYREHSKEFRVGDTVHVKEILVRTGDQAERILELLKKARRRNFSQLATLYSIAPTNANGGDMGRFAKGDLPQEMEKLFFNKLRPGRLSPIVQTKYGYHIFLLVKRSRAHHESLDSVRGRIADQLVEDHQKQLLSDKIKQLRSEKPPTLFWKKLDFGYNKRELPGGMRP